MSILVTAGIFWLRVIVWTYWREITIDSDYPPSRQGTIYITSHIISHFSPYYTAGQLLQVPCRLLADLLNKSFLLSAGCSHHPARVACSPTALSLSLSLSLSLPSTICCTKSTFNMNDYILHYTKRKLRSAVTWWVGDGATYLGWNWEGGMTVLRFVKQPTNRAVSETFLVQYSPRLNRALYPVNSQGRQPPSFT